MSSPQLPLFKSHMHISYAENLEELTRNARSRLGVMPE
jgi:hypothetical protein